jgi:molybdate-binding protein/DNA-binding XRE family transcriptional regulator
VYRKRYDMADTPEPEISNRLADLRRSRGLSAAALAKASGVSRQTIYAMEAGTYVPNTAVALRLARALDSSVENLFSLSSAPAPEPRSEPVTLLPGAEPLQPGQPVQLCRVDNRLMASPPSSVPWFLPPADAVSSGKSAAGKISARLFQPDSDFRNRILIAGCDPAISVLARHLQKSGVELILAHRNSTESLGLLKTDSVHIAGTHLRDEKTGQSNLPTIHRVFPGRRADKAVAVIAFAEWEEGILTAGGNPKQIRGVADLSRRNISIVNREPGSGSRQLLDAQLAQLGIAPKRVRGYNSIAAGHLSAAWQVHLGATDCCIATRAAARVFGLGFIPLVSERYDLAIRRRHLELPAVQTLFDTLSRSAFRRELESIGGYDTRASGSRIL